MGNKNEREINFFPRGGHHHDGEDSTKITDWSNYTQADIADLRALLDIPTQTTGYTNVSTTTPTGGSGNKYATKVVASFYSYDTTNADYVCGLNNNDVTINQALADASSNGPGRVLLMEGSYHISNKITVPNFCKLEGQGASSTINCDYPMVSAPAIQLGILSELEHFRIQSTDNSAETTTLIYGSSAWGARICNLNVFANNNGNNYLISINGLAFGTIISNCNISGGMEAIQAYGSNGISIVNNYIANTNAGRAIDVITSSSQGPVVISGNMIRNNGGIGIIVQGTNDTLTTITGNFIEANTSGGST